MKKLWFKAKLYGWGWYPCTWEGWLVILFFLLAIWFVASQFVVDQLVAKYLISLAILVALLLFICYKTGETPRWRWGK